jgi:hypothetical protein
MTPMLKRWYMAALLLSLTTAGCVRAGFDPSSASDDGTIGNGPRITKLSYSPCISELQTTPIGATANDPAGGVLTYAWHGPKGSLSGQGSRTVFTPPAEDPRPCPYTITVTVSSGATGLSVSDSAAIHVTLRADLDHDGDVDSDDGTVFNQYFGKTCPASGYCPGDLNGSGSVNTQDFLILGQDQGKTGCACP